MNKSKKIISCFIITLILMTTIMNFKTYGATMTGITPITSYEAENKISESDSVTEENINNMDVLSRNSEESTITYKTDGSDGIIVEDGVTTDLTDMFSRIRSIEEQSQADSNNANMYSSEAEEAEAGLSDNVIDDDYYSIGTNEKVTIDEYINGNVYIIADEVVINNVVGGNLFVIANKIVHNAQVIGSVYEIGKDISFEEKSDVTGSAYIMTEDFKAVKDVCINGDLRVFCSDNFDMDATVFKKTFVYTKDVILNEHAFFKYDGEISYYGDIKDYSGNYPDLVHKVDSAKDKASEATKYVNSIYFKIIKYVAALLLMIVISVITYTFGMKYDSNRQGIFNKAGTKGVINLVLVPIIGFLFLISFIGTPIGIVLITFWCIITFILAIPSLSLYLARMFLKIEDNTCGGFAKKVLFATVIYIVIDLLRMIPIIGTIISVVAIAWGYGIVLCAIGSKSVKKCNCCSKNDSDITKNNENKLNNDDENTSDDTNNNDNSNTDNNSNS